MFWKLVKRKNAEGQTQTEIDSGLTVDSAIHWNQIALPGRSLPEGPVRKLPTFSAMAKNAWNCTSKYTSI